MITPTPGRIVWYRPSEYDRVQMCINDDQPMAATVAYVCSNRMVNLTVSDHAGQTHGRTSVVLMQGDGRDLAGASPYCEWMPFQKGQAAKTEQLEKQVAGS